MKMAILCVIQQDDLFRFTPETQAEILNLAAQNTKNDATRFLKKRLEKKATDAKNKFMQNTFHKYRAHHFPYCFDLVLFHFFLAPQ